MSTWEVINSKVVILAFGFILTTITGAIIAYHFQQRSWARQTYLDLYKAKYDEGIKFLDDISELIGKRFFYLQRFMWEISSDDGNNLPRLEKEYFDLVLIWNSNYYKNRNKLRLLVGEHIATLFLDYADDTRLDPESLHYQFVHTHQIVIDSKKDKLKIREALTAVLKLNSSCSIFLEKTTNEFTDRAEKLQLLKVKQH